MSVLTNEQAVWYYDSSEEANGSSDTPVWKRYRWIETNIIENAYQQHRETVRLGEYLIHLTAMIQKKLSGDTNPRQVERRIENDLTEYAFQHRLYDPLVLPTPEERTATYGNFDSWCPFLNAWLQSTMGKQAVEDYKTCIEPCARGIIQEATEHDQCSQDRAAQMALEIRQCKKTRLELSKMCVQFYTEPSFLYYALNTALRQCDLSKLETFGPFVYLLNGHARFCKEYLGLAYRGTQLNASQLEEYRRALGMWKAWPAYTSTSKNRDVGEIFGNTLFIIEITGPIPSPPRSFDISELSQLTVEEEVLIPPGITFQIIRFDQDPEGKNIIHLQI